jgi:hypothetical protein
MDQVRPDILELACQRGTAVHTPCLAIAQGAFALAPDPSLKGYVDSFRMWFKAFVTEVLEVEPHWVHPAFQFVGHPDLVLMLKHEKKPSIVDLKTSSSSGKTWALQLSAYKELARQNGYEDVKRIFSLRLRPHGQMPLADEYLYSDRDFAAFVSALTVFRYLKRG